VFQSQGKGLGHVKRERNKSIAGLLGNASFAGPNHSVQITEIEPRQPQLHGAETDVGHHYFEEARIPFRTQGQSVGSGVLDAMTNTGQYQHFESQLEIAVAGIRVDLTVNKVAAHLFRDGLQNTMQQVGRNVPAIFVEIVPVGGDQILLQLQPPIIVPIRPPSRDDLGEAAGQAVFRKKLESTRMQAGRQPAFARSRAE